MAESNTQQRVALEQAKKAAMEYPYALIYSLSRVYLGRTPQEMDWDEVTEAHFFDESSELFFLEAEDALCAVKLTDSDTALEETYALLPGMGKELRVRKSIAFDEDGQAYFAQNRLCGWEG